MSRLTIIMTTDKNYIMPTKVAIYTMIKYSSADTYFDIHILCEKILDIESRRYLKELEVRYARLSIAFEEINIEEIRNAKTHSYIPLASYYRLYISKLLTVDKCLFIDGDVIVHCDLQELFDINIDDYYIAAVRDCAVQTGKMDFKHHERELQLPSLDDYVNAGVMLFNLRRIRSDSLDELFIKAIGDGYRFMDQDILNKICYGHIKIIPLKYNLFSEYYDRIDKMPKTLYSKEELEEAQKYPAIIHYPGLFKPWLCSRLRANKEWWNCAEEILTKQELDEWRIKAKCFEQESDFNYLLDRINEYENVAIFGFSDIGKQLLDLLIKRVPEKKFIFFDNDAQKQGLQHCGITVSAAKRIIDRKCCYIISSQNAFAVIKKQLISMGVEETKIIRYIHKDKDYYDRLDNAFKKYEEDIVRG